MNVIFSHLAIVPFILTNSQWHRIPDINIQIPSQDGQPFLRYHGYSYSHFNYKQKIYGTLRKETFANFVAQLV